MFCFLFQMIIMIIVEIWTEMWLDFSYTYLNAMSVYASFLNLQLNIYIYACK